MRGRGDRVPKEVVRQIRQAHGFSKQELARRLGIKQGESIIAEWEAGSSECEGPAAELLLLLVGSDEPASLALLGGEMEKRWGRSGNSVRSWRQVSAVPDDAVVNPEVFRALFPGVQIPAEQHAHGFPFIDEGLPGEVYALRERWTGTTPVESDRAPH